MDELAKDSRFAHIPSDPKFRRIPRNQRKVKIDKRFRPMFNDKKFTVKYTVDKRGRPVNQTSTENLRNYYELDSNEEDSDDEEDEQSNVALEKPEKKTPKKGKKVTTEQQSSESTKKTKSAKKKDDLQKYAESEDEYNDSDGDNEELEKQTPQKGKKMTTKSQSSVLKNNGKSVKGKIASEKHTKSVANDDTDEDHDDQTSNNSAESDASEDSQTVAADLKENERQLHIRGKNESKALMPDIKQKLRDLTVDYARGEGVILSDSSSDEDSTTDEEDEEDGIEHNWGELDKEAERTDEITSRLAACNMDWDGIRAVDLMIVFNSFLPPGGLIHSVTIYPSEFGIQRMKEEEVRGPIELVNSGNRNGFSDDDNEEGSEFHMERMRQYQLNRLKYYYAVIVFDSNETANKVYTECDGIEYEATATKLDLRFIPNDMEFDQEPKEVCNELPELPKYKPRQFTTTALQQVNVKLTWDETNPERQEITQKLNSGKLNEIDENDLQAYLASGSSDDESEAEEAQEQDDKLAPEEGKNDDKNPIEKYKLLLKEIENKEDDEKKKDVELEFTWGLGAKEKTEKLVKERMKKAEDLTPFDQYLEKRKAKKLAKKEQRKNLLEQDKASSDSEDSIPSDVDMNDPYFAEALKEMKPKKAKTTKNQKKSANDTDDEYDKQRKAELELLLLDKDDEKEKHHFNMKTIEENEMLSKSKKKRLSKKKKEQKEAAAEDDFQVNIHDERFAALYSSHDYNIDPANPHYRKTKGTEALINEKLKRRMNGDIKKEVPEKKVKSNRKLSGDLAALVKSVKINTKNISKPIK